MAQTLLKQSKFPVIAVAWGEEPLVKPMISGEAALFFGGLFVAAAAFICH